MNPAQAHIPSATLGSPALDARDVSCCFTLFLGRLPGNASADRVTDSSLPSLLRDILSGEEFQDGVLQAVLLGEALPHAQLGETLPLRMIDWMQTRLPVTESTRRAAGVVRSWEQAVELLLSDSALILLAPHLAAAGVDGVLRDRIAGDPAFQAKRSVVGSVDAASAYEIRGWAVDLCDKSVPVRLEFYADTMFLGSASCVEPRPDVQELVGGDGQAAFTFRIPAAHRALFGGGRALSAVDSVSRARISS
jgi:hypothetical protein